MKNFRVDNSVLFIWPDGLPQKWADMSPHDLGALGQLRIEARFGREVDLAWDRETTPWAGFESACVEVADIWDHSLEDDAALVKACDHFRALAADLKHDAPHHELPETRRVVARRGEPPKPKDAPNYGGWSEGDVMAYLSKYGKPERLPYNTIEWVVRRGLFKVTVDYASSPPEWGATLHCFETCRGLYKDTLPEAMEWAIERWRELVAESDPMPSSCPKCGESSAPCGCNRYAAFADERPCTCGRTGCPPAIHTRDCDRVQYFGTGDMGQRTTFGTGWSLLGEEGGDE